MKSFLIYLFACTFFINPHLYSQEPGSIRILILSGSNNHDWKQTTNQLERIYSETDIFSYEVTDLPDTLGSSDFIKNGGGFVTFHASSSVLYAWQDFSCHFGP